MDLSGCQLLKAEVERQARWERDGKKMHRIRQKYLRSTLGIIIINQQVSMASAFFSNLHTVQQDEEW